MAKIRVYVIAFACEPNRGSEPGAGYAFAEALARVANESDFDITLITRSHRLEQVCSNITSSVGPTELHVIGVKIPLFIVGLTKRKRVRVAYIYWQFCVVLMLRFRMRKESQSIIVHHITFATEALPTFEWMLPRNVLRVFGPAGSSQELNSESKTGFRSVIRNGLREYFGRLNLRSVDLAVAQNQIVASTFQRYGAKKVLVEPNVIVDSALTARLIDTSGELVGKPHGLISVGLLIEGKRHGMAIEALGRLGDDSLKLTIVGDGPMLSELEDLASRLGLRDRVVFVGKKSRPDTLRLIAESSVLVHASRQEGASWVVGEAQSVGTPPVVFRGSGTDTLIGIAGYGIIVESNTLDCLADGIVAALNLERRVVDRWSSERLPGTLLGWYSGQQNS